MKTYFLAFDFHNSSINKFYYGVVEEDFNKRSLEEVCIEIIKENTDIDPANVTISVKAFNNITL